MIMVVMLGADIKSVANDPTINISKKLKIRLKRLAHRVGVITSIWVSMNFTDLVALMERRYVTVE
jgi:hypothetical protein